MNTHTHTHTHLHTHALSISLDFFTLSHRYPHVEAFVSTATFLVAPSSPFLLTAVSEEEGVLAGAEGEPQRLQAGAPQRTVALYRSPAALADAMRLKHVGEPARRTAAHA